MILIHTTFIILLFLMITILWSIINYSHILILNYNWLNHPIITTQLDNNLTQSSKNKIVNDIIFWDICILPQSIIAIIALPFLWWNIINNINEPIWYTLLITVLMTNTFIAFTTKDLYPDWLFNLAVTIHNIQQQQYLEDIQHKLNTLKHKLINAEQNKLSEVQIDWIKVECLVLSREVFSMTNNQDEVQKIDNILNDKVN